MPKCPKCHFQWVSTTRSDKQNNYYFGVVVDMIAEEIGDDLIETHHILKKKFLPVDKKSTTQLTTVEFNTYIEKIQRWAAQELQCVIPDPI